MFQLEEFERSAAPYLRLSEDRGCTFRALLEAAVRTFGRSTGDLAMADTPNEPTQFGGNAEAFESQYRSAASAVSKPPQPAGIGRVFVSRFVICPNHLYNYQNGVAAAPLTSAIAANTRGNRKCSSE